MDFFSGIRKIGLINFTNKNFTNKPKGEEMRKNQSTKNILKGKAVSVLFAMAIFSVGASENNYSRAVQPKIKLDLIPLPTGSIKVQGWLRSWGQNVADNLVKPTAKTKNSQQKQAGYKDFCEGWTKVLSPLKIGSTEKKVSIAGCQPYHTSGMFFDGCLRMGYALDDKELIDIATKQFQFVLDNQSDEGFLGPGPKGDKGILPELWREGKAVHDPLGIFMRGMYAWYSATGNEKIIKAMEKHYLQFKDFKEWSCKRYLNIGPLLETYSHTGNEQLLQNAINDDKDHFKWGYAGHGARFNKYQNGMGALAYYTGEKKYMEPFCDAYKEALHKYMLPHGVIHSDEAMRGVSGQKGTETCTLADLMWGYTWMYRINGDTFNGDLIEKAFYNAGGNMVNRKGNLHVYHQALNRIKRGGLVASKMKGTNSTKHLENPLDGHYSYKPQHGPSCCTGQIPRVFGVFMGSMWMATADGGLACTLYGPCSVNALAGNKNRVKIDVKTDYPFRQDIAITVTPEKTEKFPLYFRIPAWCKNSQITVNEKTIPVTPNEKGFVCITREWSKNDIVKLKFPMKGIIKLSKTKIAKAYPKKVTYTIYPDRPFAVVNYGPLLFSLPLPEKDVNTPLDTETYQVALNVNVEKPILEIKENPMPESWEWQLNAPLQIIVKGQSFNWADDEITGLPYLPKESVKDDKSKEKDLILVPYGCAKLRVSMFPITESTAKSENVETSK